MKLQSSQSGGWRNVVEFPIEKDAEVRAAAVMLARAAGHCSLRILNPEGEVAASWSPFERVWREYPFRRAL